MDSSTRTLLRVCTHTAPRDTHLPPSKPCSLSSTQSTDGFSADPRVLCVLGRFRYYLGSLPLCSLLLLSLSYFYTLLSAFFQIFLFKEVFFTTIAILYKFNAELLSVC